jgi:pimeloyl-ACP methyl ester carboxylesterase
MAADRPTIVFVHGAWADASGFGGVIRALGDRGSTAIGMANPLRHLTGDAAYLASLLGTISGAIVLVGHSYGGDPATRERRRVRHAFRPAGVAVDPVVVPGGHRGPSHPAGRAAIHGRAWERTDRGGGGLARVHGVAAGGRDPADPERCGGDQLQPDVSE